MAFHPPSYSDIVNSKYAAALPATQILPQTETRNYFQAIDNMLKVFAIQPGDEMLFLTDPLLDRRVVDAISGIANSRGVFPREFMAPTSRPNSSRSCRGGRSMGSAPGRAGSTLAMAAVIFSSGLVIMA